MDQTTGSATQDTQSKRASAEPRATQGATDSSRIPSSAGDALRYVADEVERTIETHPKMGFLALAGAGIAAVVTFGVSEVVLGAALGYLGLRALRRRHARASASNGAARSDHGSTI